MNTKKCCACNKQFIIEFEGQTWCGMCNITYVIPNTLTPKSMSVSGIKHDEGKLRWDLLPFEHIEEVVRVLTHGAKKYSGDNWKHVPDPKNRYFAAAMRHITAWRKGERFDADSNNNLHLAAVIANILFLMHFDKEENA